MVIPGFDRKNKWRYGGDAYPYWSAVVGSVPQNTPHAFWMSLKVLRRALRIVGLSVIIAIFVELILIWKVITGDRVFTSLDVFLVCSPALCYSLLYVYGIRIARGRFRKFLEANNWMVCIECGYLLCGLPDGYKCPECGMPYTYNILRRRWTQWYNGCTVYE